MNLKTNVVETLVFVNATISINANVPFLYIIYSWVTLKILLGVAEHFVPKDE